MLRSIFFLVILTISVNDLYSQCPVVQSISQRSTTMDEILEITGVNFGTNAANIKVLFGAAEGKIMKIQNNLILVKVPLGATFQKISVVNTTLGLEGASKDPFLLSFGGQGLLTGNFESQVNFPGDLGLYDHCLGDFDLDGKVDAALANFQSNNITVLRNTSTLTSINFAAKEAFDAGSPTSNIISGDVDGDGKLDLIVSKYPTATTVADKIYIFRNISITTAGLEDIIFAPYKEISVEGNNAKNIVIHDLDADGKPEIIVSNEANNIISILKNESTLGNLNFNSTITKIAVLDVDKCSGLTLSDLNGDNKPEIITTAYLGNNIYILPNISGKSAIGFAKSQVVYVSGNIINVVAGDLNGDTKPDLAVSKILSGNISVVINNTATIGGDILFTDPPKDFITAPQPWGLDIGDLDGDGRPDLAIASVFSGNLITVLKNTSVNGTLTFAPKIDISVAEPNRSVKIGDINGDGKPDLTFTSINSAKLSVIRNKHCVLAKVFTLGSTTLCPGQKVVLFTQKGNGLTYQWKKNGTDISSANQNSLLVSSADAGDYKVIITGESGACSFASNTVSVTAASGTIPTGVLASNTGPVCEGSPVSLKAATVSGATYEWIGPNGFTSALQNPLITSVDYTKTGSYYLKITVGSCSSDYDTTIVALNNSSLTAAITSASGNIICDNLPLNLQVNAAIGSTYQWFIDESPIGGANSSTYSAAAPGVYTVSVTSSDGCNATSNGFKVIKPAKVSPDFTMPTSSCSNTSIALVNNTVVPDASLNIKYFWDFGNGVYTSEKDPVLKRPKYAVAGIYKVKLRITVEDKCIQELEKSITISDNFKVDIQTSNTGNIFCSGEGITLMGPEGYSGYKWSKGTNVIAESTVSTIKVNEAGTYSLEVSKDGCSGTGSIILQAAEKPIITAEIVTPAEKIIPGDSIELRAGGADSFSWSPADGLSNDSIANPKAFVSKTQTYTVVGTNLSGCTDTTSVTVIVSNEILIKANNVFTPNGDSKNETWVVDNIENYKSCNVIVLNRQGQKVFEAMPYNNDWNGTMNGRKLPEGSYFFIIQCPETGTGKTGSVTIVR
jgi:gliding motility-associated-like protein